jgi:DNA repair protein RadC
MSQSRSSVNEPPTYHSKITHWPKAERPREKLLTHGATLLSDSELLAILIRTGTGNITAVDLAKKLLQDFGSLHHLAARTVQDLKRYRGLGEVKSLSLVAAFEVGRRSAVSDTLEQMRIISPADIVKRFQPLLRDMKHEVFKVLLLDSANHLIRDVTVSTGILNSSLVHPREVFSKAITEPAASIILLHNHPSGNPEPSAEDLQITRQLVEAGKIIGIPVHDHVILTSSSYTSFAERGIL